MRNVDVLYNCAINHSNTHTGKVVMQTLHKHSVNHTSLIKAGLHNIGSHPLLSARQFVSMHYPGLLIKCSEMAFLWNKLSVLQTSRWREESRVNNQCSTYCTAWSNHNGVFLSHMTHYNNAWGAVTVLNTATKCQDIFLLLQKLCVNSTGQTLNSISLEVWLVLHNQIVGCFW